MRSNLVHLTGLELYRLVIRTISLTGGDRKDERIEIQDERYERFKDDMAQRKIDGVRQMSFDDWAEKYEWRYDAAERKKNRLRWPNAFNPIGLAPMPIQRAGYSA